MSNQRITRLVRLTCLTTKNPSDIARRVIQGFDYSIEYVAFPNNTYLAHVHINPRGGQSQQAMGELLQRLVEALSPRNFTITVYYNSSTRVFRNRVPSPGEL